VPWKAVCFQQAIALQIMFHHRGVPGILHYGVAQFPDGNLKAHVWVSVSGDVVLGGRTADQFTCLAKFPGDNGRVH
jgi:hypothetical protein